MSTAAFRLPCPLGAATGAPHSAEFDCEARTLDCAVCGFALSRVAAGMLFRLVDRHALLEQVVAAHVAGLVPGALLENAIRSEGAMP